MSIERKLRKRARKLAKWARKHGYEFVDVFTLAPHDDYESWYAHIDATRADGSEYHDGSFYEEAELDE